MSTKFFLSYTVIECSLIPYLKLHFSFFANTGFFLSFCCHFTRRWRSVLSSFFYNASPAAFVLCLLPFMTHFLVFLCVFISTSLSVSRINIVIREKSAVHLKGSSPQMPYVSHIGNGCRFVGLISIQMYSHCTYSSVSSVNGLANYHAARLM